MKSNKNILVSASVLGADLTAVRDAVSLCEKSGIDVLHIDVMDGHFVPQITFGNKFTSDIKKITHLPLDVHLMVNSPSIFIDDYITAGADSISFHIENDIHINRTLNSIKEKGVKAGICLVPSTPVSALSEIIDIVDFIQVMTVNPGFSGQKMILSCIKKIGELDKLREIKDLNYKILVDGGVNRDTAGMLVDAGADVLITASAFFNSKNPAEEVLILKNSGRKQISG
ncbi:MAG: ribulose-phosphate 3-epimerase [Spirochaetales bacterium]|nr:ribulose-phosphate 3-epimerase [Spirochaetales bacterium]